MQAAPGIMPLPVHGDAVQVPHGTHPPHTGHQLNWRLQNCQPQHSTQPVRRETMACWQTCDSSQWQSSCSIIAVTSQQLMPLPRCCIESRKVNKQQQRNFSSRSNPTASGTLQQTAARRRQLERTLALVSTRQHADTNFCKQHQLPSRSTSTLYSDCVAQSAQHTEERGWYDTRGLLQRAEGAPHCRQRRKAMRQGYAAKQ